MTKYFHSNKEVKQLFDH